MTKNQRLINLRKLKKMSQEEFANSIGMTQAHYSRVESGKNELPLTAAASIIKTYKVASNWLLYLEGDDDNPNFENDLVPKKELEQAMDTISVLQEQLIKYQREEIKKLQHQNQGGSPVKH